MNFELQNQTTQKIRPKDFFLNISWLIALYGTVISFIALSFGVINQVFVDSTEPFRGVTAYSTGIRIAISWLIVVFPLFLIISRFLRKMFIANPSLRDLWIRKWLIYLNLFLSCGTLVVDLIMTINVFLGGDLSSRFFIKAGAVFIVAGFTLYYHITELRDQINLVISRLFSLISIILVIGLLITSFIIIGSPMNERLRRFDDKKVQNIQDLNWQIQRYYNLMGSLPNKTTWKKDLESKLNITIPTDPQTGNLYDYEPDTSMKNNYTICADFNLERPATYIGDVRAHRAGKDCFKQIISRNESVKPVPVQ